MNCLFFNCDLKFNHRAFFVNLNDTYNVGDYVIKVTWWLNKLDMLLHITVVNNLASLILLTRFWNVLGLWWLTQLSTIFLLHLKLSVVLVEETGVLGESHRPSQVTKKLYHIMLYRVHLVWITIRSRPRRPVLHIEMEMHYKTI